MSNKPISYLEFRKAAIRNIAACDILLKNYHELKPATQKHILHKIYYLGGYVVEFLYKFSLFSHLNLSHTEDVYKFKDTDFQKKWKVHDYRQLNNLCEKEGLKFSTDIPFFGNNTLNKNIATLFDGWDVQIRYSQNLCKREIELRHEDLIVFLSVIKDINNKINSTYS